MIRISGGFERMHAHGTQQNPAEIGFAGDLRQIVKLAFDEVTVCFAEYTDPSSSRHSDPYPRQSTGI